MKPPLSALPLQLTLAAVLAALLPGCASTPAPTTLLALPPVALPARAPADAASAPRAPLRVLVVRRVEIPEYLQARAVRYRLDETRLEAWPQVAWAERLEVAMTRSIVDGLRQRLHGWAVCEGSCTNLKQDVSLTVDFGVLDFYAQGPKLDARARWVLRTSEEPPKLSSGRWQAPADLLVGGGMSGQAAAFGAAAQAVAADIAAQLERSALPAAANQALPLAGQR